MIHILFVCLGNICRSPLAESIFKKLVNDAGLQNTFCIDSAGIYGYHEGELPDARMQKHAFERGYVLDSRSRPVNGNDFYTFDWIIGMDDSNIASLRQMAPDLESTRKIHRMTAFSTQTTYDYVPDPYYGGAAGFELVVDLLEDACQGLLTSVLSNRDN